MTQVYYRPDAILLTKPTVPVNRRHLCFTAFAIRCCFLLIVFMQVQGTNDSSIGSKFSMSNLGYFDDDFVKYFAGKPCRRAPIINRCITWNHFLCRSYFECDVLFFTGSIARSATCWYLIYSEADFEVFCPAGVTRCTDGGEIWHGAKFHPHRCNNKGIGPPKLNFLLRFDQNVEYKCPTGAYPLLDFHKICIVCTPFQDLFKGLWSYGGLKLTGSAYAQILSAP